MAVQEYTVLSGLSGKEFPRMCHLRKSVQLFPARSTIVAIKPSIALEAVDR